MRTAALGGSVAVTHDSKNIADTSPPPHALTAEIPYYLYYSQVQYEARSEPVSLPSYRGRTGAQERLPSRGRYGHAALAKVSGRLVGRAYAVRPPFIQ